MKICVIFISIFVLYATCISRNYKFFPNLPVGEYRVFVKAIMICLPRDSDLQPNFYLNRRSRSVTEARGNVTSRIPLDDSLTFHATMAVKDSIGGWKENAFEYTASNACTNFKSRAGPDILPWLRSQGIHIKDCPIPAGVYVLKDGYDLTNISSTWDIPKQFFYGTYRLRTYFTDKHNKKIGCIAFIVDIKRPWEQE